MLKPSKDRAINKEQNYYGKNIAFCKRQQIY